MYEVSLKDIRFVLSDDVIRTLQEFSQTEPFMTEAGGVIFGQTRDDIIYIINLCLAPS